MGPGWGDSSVCSLSVRKQGAVGSALAAGTAQWLCHIRVSKVCHFTLRFLRTLNPLFCECENLRSAKDCIDILISPITSIINLSLTEGCFLSHFKAAHVSPLLKKKPSLNQDSMGNYRPVSNLSFLSKVLEKVVVYQLNANINSSNILSSIDDGTVTALTLLDLSAAFDTIDHTILLRRLGNWFGVSGKVLDWFKSYFTDRSQRIKLGNCLSSKSDLSFGVPQGSVLGPLLFTLYTTPLSSLVSGHAIPHHLYADDSQLYVSFSSGDCCSAEWSTIMLGFCPVMDVDK